MAKQMLVASKSAEKMRSDMPFVAYVLDIWNWNSSPYIRRRNKASTRALGDAYVIGKYSSLQKHCPGFFKKRPLSAIKEQDLDDFAEYLMDKDLANSTVINIVNGCKQALKWALYEGRITREIKPMLPISRKGKDRDCFTDQEVRCLLQGQWESSATKMMFQTALITGLRIGEILALRYENLGEGYLEITHSWNQVVGIKSTKNGKTRIVPIPETLMTCFKAYLEAAGIMHGFLFPGTKPDCPITSNVPRNELKAAMLAAGIPREEQKARGLGFHSCRHWCNTRFRRVTDEVTLRQVIGHSDVKMTNRYDHQRSDDLERFREAQALVFKEVSA